MPVVNLIPKLVLSTLDGRRALAILTKHNGFVA